MRTDVAGWLGLAVVGLSAGHAVAQPERYELGQRLKRFEQAWEEQKDPATRKRALAVVKNASGQFLSLQLGEAGRTLDAARWALQDKSPTDVDRWMEGLYVVPEKRVIDAGLFEPAAIRIEIRRLYAVMGEIKKEVPPNCEVQVFVRHVGNRFADAPFIRLQSLPTRTEVLLGPTMPGDYPLTALYWHAPVHHARLNVGSVSVVRNLSQQLATWKQVAKGAAWEIDKGIELEQATVRDLAATLCVVAEGNQLEIDMPAVQAADQMNTIATLAVSGNRYFTRDRPGDFRLTVPTGKGTLNSCRLLVPKGLGKDKPVPLVVALHGAGGSENLFFEGYGNGHIVKECQKRGWMLLSPRSGLIGAAPVAAIIDKLAERYPIDPKRIFLVGHSMGAGQAVELVQQHPGKFAAVASLGGAGRVRKKEVFADLPVFVGVGDQDFALKGSRALHQALTDAGAKRTTYKEYPDLEHLVIVREALPDVFAGWDEIAKK